MAHSQLVWYRTMQPAPVQTGQACSLERVAGEVKRNFMHSLLTLQHDRKTELYIADSQGLEPWGMRSSEVNQDKVKIYAFLSNNGAA